MENKYCNYDNIHRKKENIGYVNFDIFFSLSQSVYTVGGPHV